MSSGKCRPFSLGLIVLNQGVVQFYLSFSLQLLTKTICFVITIIIARFQNSIWYDKNKAFGHSDV